MRGRGALLLLAACADAPSPPDAATVIPAFEALHAPVYEVFELGTDRDAVHDHLARAFAGEALTRQYVEHWRALWRMDREQTAIEVLGVEYDEVALLDGTADEVRVDAAWLVRGVVTHQGHRHPRINRYRAVYTLAATPDGWRITDTHLRDLARVASRVAADAVFDEGAGTGTEDGFMDPLEMFRGGLFDAPPSEDAK